MCPELWYQNFSNRKTALISGDWKLVNRKFLYNIKEDLIESKDLSKLHPERMHYMLTEWGRLDTDLNEGKASGGSSNKYIKK